MREEQEGQDSARHAQAVLSIPNCDKKYTSDRRASCPAVSVDVVDCDADGRGEFSLVCASRVRATAAVTGHAAHAAPLQEGMRRTQPLFRSYF